MEEWSGLCEAVEHEDFDRFGGGGGLGGHDAQAEEGVEMSGLDVLGYEAGLDARHIVEESFGRCGVLDWW